MVFSSEAKSALGNAIVGRYYTRAFACYCHDSDKGFSFSAGYHPVVTSCIIANCTTGVSFWTNDYTGFLTNNTVYNCTTGFSFTVGTYARNQGFNNIFINCTTGISFDAEYTTNYFDYNFYYGCTATTSNLTEGPNSDETQTLPPAFVDAANGNFALGTALRGKGFPGEFPGGLTTGALDPGAVQSGGTTATHRVKMKRTALQQETEWAI